MTFRLLSHFLIESGPNGLCKVQALLLMVDCAGQDACSRARSLAVDSSILQQAAQCFQRQQNEVLAKLATAASMGSFHAFQEARYAGSTNTATK